MSLGVILFLFGLLILLNNNFMSGIIPLLVGCSLVYLSLFRNRAAGLVFGHFCIVIGCYLVTWGIYLLSVSQPILAYIFCRPLFWGLFSIFGGICAIYHHFCQCILRQVEIKIPIKTKSA
jgi:hypothetical protein